MDPAKFTAFNVLEDEALRAGMFSLIRYPQWIGIDIGVCNVWKKLTGGNRYQRVLGMANDTAIIC